jgi:Protein of unknown function (DUF3500)
VDIVGGNRAHLSDGDTVMPLPDLWRGRFTEPRLRDLVHTMHETAEAKARLRPEHHRALSLTSAPKGIAAAAMTDSQRELLKAVLGVFIGRIPEELAEQEAEKFAGQKLDAVHFAWAGGIEPGQPHYYRLQGCPVTHCAQWSTSRVAGPTCACHWTSSTRTPTSSTRRRV